MLQPQAGSPCMRKFDNIKRALIYIDEHLDERIGFEQLADIFHFSPYYFHRMFSVIVGKTIAAHVRDRRLEKSCRLLADTKKTVLSICMECGFDSAQSFSRAFRSKYGMSPNEYRKRGCFPVLISAEDLIINFTNRLKGGILVNPNLIKKDALLIAGVTGDGNRTGEIWQEFEKLNNEIGLANKLSDNGYEIRIHDGIKCDCHVGFAVSDKNVNPAYTVTELPASRYASFDVYVSRGYGSENTAMNQWLEANGSEYSEKLLAGKNYVVEYYDERFKGDESDSIVEIWVPIEKTNAPD